MRTCSRGSSWPTPPGSPGGCSAVSPRAPCPSSFAPLSPLPVPAFLSGASAGKRRSGVVGAFAIGLMSGLVVGPCTAPVLGALLVYVGARQNVLFGTSLLFVFALGMGVFLLVVGAFTGVLANLPTSGRWTGGAEKG